MAGPFVTHLSIPEERFSIRSWGKITKTMPSAHWVDVFLRWRDVQHRYLDQVGEPPWWYSERPQIGFFATAIHLGGGTALQEYSSRQIRGNTSAAARIDLCATIHSRNYLVEAKSIFPNIEDSKIRETVASAIKTAAGQLSQYTAHKDNRAYKETPLLAAFVAPWCPRSQSLQLQREATDGFLATDLSAELRTGYRVDFYPDFSIAKSVQANVKNTEHIYPGITLLIGM